MMALLATGVLAVGCATQGEKLDMAAVDSMQPGVTTLADAKAKLGKPYSVTTNEDGTKSVIWMYTHVNLVAGTKQQAVSVVFDKNDKMVKVGQRIEHD
jgi:outer membrane protein assembly factor BamE (lipoprotein component of BamABCDE complex)